MELYVIRHGESEANKQGLHCGWGDVPLTPLGHKQAQSSGKLINHIKFDLVYVSDLLRAKQTAENALPDYTHIFMDKLREINVGKLKFHYPSDCLKKYGQLYVDAKNKHDYRELDGESLDEMLERVSSFMREIEQLNNVNNVAVVAHEGTVHCILSYVLQHNIEKKLTRHDNCAISKFSYQNGIWKLNIWNYNGAI